MMRAGARFWDERTGRRRGPSMVVLIGQLKETDGRVPTMCSFPGWRQCDVVSCFGRRAWPFRVGIPARA